MSSDSDGNSSNGDSGHGAEDSSEQSELRLRRSLEMLSGGARPERSEQPANRRRDGGDHSGKPSSYSAPNPRRHRFKDDGEVQVVHVAPHRDRGAERAAGGSASLLPARTSHVAHPVDPHAAEDRAARERAERALEAARDTIHHLQTRIGHAELAAREAVEQAEAHVRTIAELREELLAERAQAAAARLAVEAAEDARLAADANAEAEIEQHRRALDAAKEEIRDLMSELRTALLTKDRAAAAPAPGPRAATRKPAVARRAAPVVVEVEEEAEPVKWWLPAEKKATGTRRTRG